MRKKILSIALAALLVLSLVACGKNSIEGTWDYVSGDAQLTGITNIPYSLTFQKGKLTMIVDFDKAGLAQADAAFARQMTSLAVIAYEILGDGQIRIAISVASIGYNDVKTYAYRVDGDTLTLDGAMFKRK